MNYKIDYPFPPKHYKSVTGENHKIHPNLDDFFRTFDSIHIFGQSENIKKKEIRIHPNYLVNCKKILLTNKTLKEELLNLLKELKNSIKDYFCALNKDTEDLNTIQKNIYDISLQIFYVLKIAHNTIGSSVQLKKVLNEEIEENKKLINLQQKNISDLKLLLN